MSMPKIEKSDNPIDREQSVSNLVESVALMETGLSHIINAEGEKIQKVIKYDEDVDVPLEDIIKVNDSASKMVNSITKLEMILQNKLDVSKDLDTVGMPGPTGPTGPMGPTGPVGPEIVKSSFVEVLGDTQTIAASEAFIFVAEDIVGNDISFQAPGNEIIINNPGLYSVEWSANLSSGNPQTVIGITENDEPTSALTFSGTSGNASSGALLHVETVPCIIKLINFANPIEIESFTGLENTAVSLRIFKFADEPNI